MDTKYQQCCSLNAVTCQGNKFDAVLLAMNLIKWPSRDCGALLTAEMFVYFKLIINALASTSDIGVSSQLWIITTKPPIKTVTASHPAKKPCQDIFDGNGISRPRDWPKMRRGGGVTPSGSVQGSRTFSPRVTGVRIRA